ncbi:unnamed protein product, partial [Mesorhabditis belari]|uniref:Gamma-interferon-inducible lysosomal thiol reductase n=1 Tax=Mesorhabditis belari TaxID=2138241 RepID=A0AAF3EVK6_9BILA
MIFTILLVTLLPIVTSKSKPYFANPLCQSTPPALWCENNELAKDCGWDLACQDYKKGTYNKPILITLLYESLCPGCQNFITHQLYNQVFLKFPPSVVQIELVPYGNAKIKEGEIVCQHGEEECQINKFESCLIDSMNNDFRQYIPVIYCIESQLSNKIPFDKAQSKCFRTLNVTSDVERMTQSCLVSKLSTKLQLAAAARTDNVQPEKHFAVPWVLFNNVSLASAQDLTADLPLVICQWYKGDTKPKACANDSRTLRRKYPFAWKTDL